MADLAQLNVVIKTSGLQPANQGLNNLNVVVNATQNNFDKLSKSTNSYKSASSSLATQLQGLVLRLTSIVSVGKLIQSVFREAFSFENAKLAFTTMLGSAEQAVGMIDKLRNISSSSGFSFDALADATKLYLALGGAASTAERDIKAMAAQTAAMGQGAQQIDRLALALGQIKAKGYVAGEEVRQLANNNVRVWEYLIKVLHVDVATAMDYARRKIIDADAAVEVILQGMAKDFGSALDLRLKTVPGAFDRLVNEIKRNMAEIGETFFSTINATGILNTLSSTASDVGKILMDTISILGGLQAKFVGTEPYARKLAEALRAIWYILEAIIALKVAFWFSDLQEHLNGLVNTIKQLSEALIVIGVAVAGFEIGRWASQFKEVQVQATNLLYALMELKARAADFFENIMHPKSSSIKEQIDALEAEKKATIAQINTDFAEGGKNSGPHKSFAEVVKDDAKDAVAAISDVYRQLYSIPSNFNGESLLGITTVRRSLTQIQHDLDSNPPIAIKGKLVVERDEAIRDLGIIATTLSDLNEISPRMQKLSKIADIRAQMDTITNQMDAAKDEGTNTDKLNASYGALATQLEGLKNDLKSIKDDDAVDWLNKKLSESADVAKLASQAYGGVSLDWLQGQLQAGKITVAGFAEQLNEFQKTLSGVDESMKFTDKTAADLLKGGAAEDGKKFANLLDQINKRTAELKASAGDMSSSHSFEDISVQVAKYRAELQRLGQITPQAEAQLKAFQEAATDEAAWKKTLDLFKNFADTMANTFDDIIMGTKSVGEAFRDMLQDISRQIIHQMVTQPIANGLSQALLGSFGGVFARAFGASGAGAGAGVGAGAAAGANAGIGAAVASALGNVFENGRLHYFAMGGVPDLVNQPTMFPMRRGMGVMGEAGPEAVIPLKRGANGRLGIEGGGGQVTNVYNNVHITSPNADSFKQSETQIRRRLKRFT